MRKKLRQNIRNKGTKLGKREINRLAVQPRNEEQEWGFGSLFSFIFAFLCIFGQASAADYFTVIGPDVPVIARAGMDTLLFCSLSPSISALNMEIRWYRINPDSVLYIYKDGEENIDLQVVSYRGRTEFVKDNISTGVIGLRIRNIQTSDKGTYACYFEGPSYHNRASFSMEVTALGSDPEFSIATHQDGEIQLMCRSTGWYPEPEVLWRKADGMSLTSTSTSKDSDNTGLFNMESTVTLTNKEKVTCHLNSLPLKTNKSITIEVSDIFFSKSCHYLKCETVVIIVGCVLAACLTILIMYLKCHSRDIFFSKSCHYLKRELMIIIVGCVFVAYLTILIMRLKFHSRGNNASAAYQIDQLSYGDRKKRDMSQKSDPKCKWSQAEVVHESEIRPIMQGSLTEAIHESEIRPTMQGSLTEAVHESEIRLC